MTDFRMPEGIIYAERAETHAKHPAVFPAGRVCDEPSCTTQLSIYNRSATCAAHARFQDTGQGHRVHRGRRSRSQERIAA